MRDAASRLCKSPRKRPAWTSPSMPGAPFPLPDAALAIHRMSVATGSPSIRTSPSRATRAMRACRNAGRSVTSFRNTVPPREAAIRLSRAAHSRSAGMRQAPRRRAGGRAGPDRRRRSPHARNAGWAARLLVQLACDGFDVRPAWRQQQDAALGEGRAAHEILDSRDGRRASHELARRPRAFPGRRAPEIRSTTVMVSGMAGLE